MKVVNICSECRGKGLIRRAGFLSRKCQTCKGTGKMTRSLREYKLNE